MRNTSLLNQYLYLKFTYSVASLLIYFSEIAAVLYTDLTMNWAHIIKYLVYQTVTSVIIVVFVIELTEVVKKDLRNL